MIDDVKKDEEFAKLLLELKNKTDDIKEPEFSKMRYILDYLKEFGCDEKTFNKHFEDVNKLLYNLSSHIFDLEYTLPYIYTNPPKIRIPGCHDYNSCLNRNYFDWYLYKDFYKQFCDKISILIESEGLIYPRLIPEIKDSHTRDKNNPNKEWYRVRTNIFIRREDMPDKETFDKCDYGSNGKYYICYFGCLASPEKTWEFYHNILKKTHHINEIKEIYDKDMIETYPISKEINDNYDKYLNLNDIDFSYITERERE